MRAMPTSWNPANWRSLEEMTRAEPTLGVQDLPPVSPQHSDGLEEIAAEPAHQVLQELGRAATDDLPTYEDEVEEEEEDEDEEDPASDYQSGEAWQTEWDQARRDGQAERLEGRTFETWADVEGWRWLKEIWRRKRGHPKQRWYILIGCREPNAWLGSLMALYSKKGGVKGQGMTLRLLHDSSLWHFDDPLLVTSQAQYNRRADGMPLDYRLGGLGWDHLSTKKVEDWKELKVCCEYRRYSSKYVALSRFDFLAEVAMGGAYNEPQKTPRSQLEARLEGEDKSSWLQRNAGASAPTDKRRKTSGDSYGAGAPAYRKPRKAHKTPEPPQMRSADAQFAAVLEKLKETKNSIDRGHQAELQLLREQLASERDRNVETETRARELSEKEKELAAYEKRLATREAEVRASRAAVEAKDVAIQRQAAATDAELDDRKKGLDDREQRLEARERGFEERKKRLRAQLDDDAAE